MVSEMCLLVTVFNPCVGDLHPLTRFLCSENDLGEVYTPSKVPKHTSFKISACKSVREALTSLKQLKLQIRV